MKIALDASPLLVQNKTGVGHFTQGLLEAAVRLDPSIEYELVYFAVPGRPLPPFAVKGPNVKHRRIWWFPGKLYNLLLRTPLRLPIDLLTRLNADLFFFPNFSHWPLVRINRSVVVIHDLAYLEVPETVIQRHRWYLSRAVPAAIKRATHVIAVSEHTKKQLVETYGTNPHKISVVTNAVDHNLFKPMPAPATEAVRTKYGITKPYILYLGTLEPRKNIVGVVKAYESLPAELKDQYQLVLAGGRGWLDEEIKEVISLIPQHSVVATGYIPAEDKPALYAGATCFVYPSLYEGWGMQLLEAMACGVPVISANNSSLPEAGGDAAEYVPTGDQNALNSALSDLLHDPKKRHKMALQGIAFAATYTWESSARKLIEVFRRAA